MEKTKRNQWERGNPLTLYLSFISIVFIFAIFVIPFEYIGVSSTTVDLVLAGLALVGITAGGLFTWGLWNGIRWGYHGLLALGALLIVSSSLGLLQHQAGQVEGLMALSTLQLLFVAGAGHSLIIGALMHPRRNELRDQPTIAAAFRDLRILRLIFQIIFAILVAVALSVLWSNVYNTLLSRNLLPTFGFLDLRAGFSVNESPEWYSTASTYGQAFMVGVINTLRAVSIGLVGATVLGILLGIFLLSNNWLIRNISRAYVEILRNTPILVQLIFWYFVVMLSLPRDNVTLPSEGVFILALRIFVYLVALAGIWYYSTRAISPSRVFSGAILGVVGLEVLFHLIGTSSIVIIAFGIIGALLIGFSRTSLPKNYIGWVEGAGLMAVIQLVGHGLLDVLARSEVTPHPQVLYGEVFPAIYLGRDGFIYPEFWTNNRTEVLLAGIVGGLLLGWVVSQIVGAISERTGHPLPSTAFGILTLVLLVIGGWFVSFLNIPADLGRSAFYAQWELIGEPFNFAPTLATPRFTLFLILAAVALIIGAAAWYLTKRFLQSRFVDVPSITLGLLTAVALLLMSWHITRLPAVSGELLIVQQQQIVNEEGEVTDTEISIIELTRETAADSEFFGDEISDEKLAFEFSDDPLNVVLPEKGRFRFETGSTISLSFAALVIGLVIYTSAFIGEIVRAGIQAVPHGQIEASRALGLSNAKTLRMVILPQALRVIIPPLGNQYLNLAKNSSLATAIAFADTYQIGTTIMNQSGQSITGFTLVLLTYLIMSLVISLAMNIVNSRFQLVTR